MGNLNIDLNGYFALFSYWQGYYCKAEYTERLLCDMICSSRLGTAACIFLDLFQDLIGDILSVVGDMPVIRETSMVASSSSRIC